MRDALTVFGDEIKITGAASGTAVSAEGKAIDLRTAAKEHTLHDLRLVFVANDADVSAATVTLKSGDDESALEEIDSYKLTNMKMGTPKTKPFPLEHGRYLAIAISSEENATFSAALEFGA